MSRSFLQQYFDDFSSIEGWFTPDAALLFMAYNQVIASRGIAGDVLEIGVHQGLSAIAIAALRAPTRHFYAVDLFDDLQVHNTSGSGSGKHDDFLRNMGAFHGDVSFVRVIASPSGAVRSSDLGSEFAFCHVDGGHSASETYSDIRLCHEILSPGGLLALDDYFNPAWPGVAEGAIRYVMEHPRDLVPVAIGFNKALFQRGPPPFDVNAVFASAFPGLPKRTVEMFGVPTYLFTAGWETFFDVERSTPQRLIMQSWVPMAVRIEPLSDCLTVERGQCSVLPLRLACESTLPIRWEYESVGVSYHLRASDGTMLRWDNARSYFRRPLAPGETRELDLSIAAPDTPGRYAAEVDIVWEGVTWLKQQGGRTATVDLIVV
jgi:hypothetical protein